MMLQLQELCNKSEHIVKNELRTNDYYAGLLPDGYWYRYDSPFFVNNLIWIVKLLCNNEIILLTDYFQ